METRSLSSFVTAEDNGNRDFVRLAGGYVLVAILVARACHLRWGSLSFLLCGAVLSGTCVVMLLLMHAVWCLYRDRPHHPFPAVWQDWKSVVRERGLIGLPVLLGYPLFMATFFTLKCQFSQMRQYTWDPVFVWADCVVHGSLPSRWVLPLLDCPWFVLPLSFIYCQWFLLNAIVLGWMAFSLDFPLRRRFWVSFVLCWLILGTIGALGFLSAGPCFYDQVTTGENPYAQHMAALRSMHNSIPVTSVQLQDALRAGLGKGGLVGASAMPSMHVSMCVLFTLAGWQHSRRIGVVLLTVTILTQAACVVLGWHYAVDGYAGALGTWLIWWAMGKTTGKKGVSP